ncbi:RidA family protein [Rhizobium mayense]|uniref:RidA family protein n=1 Tax=Rhizobium mayense TaxID=1312184 RepID=A0ABT7JT10_9HYPH|nr:RidA family protein [Rhizobium mayense]MDL2399489.1 RidA family protein [Rhizobium mayense]
MAHSFQDIGVAKQIGNYSDATIVDAGMRWLITSGTPGLPIDGSTLPSTTEAQADLAWRHILTMLANAGMDVADIVKVTQYLTRAEDIKAYADVRRKYLGDARPASMLLVIPQLVWPNLLVEIEVIAAKAA